MSCGFGANPGHFPKAIFEVSGLHFLCIFCMKSVKWTHKREDVPVRVFHLETTERISVKFGSISLTKTCRWEWGKVCYFCSWGFNFICTLHDGQIELCKSVLNNLQKYILDLSHLKYTIHI
jgi:hypothetical protein